MVDDDQAAAGGGGGAGSFLKRKLGPLPTWAWMGLSLGAALAYASWRNSQGGGSGAAGDAVAQKYELPDSIQPTYTWIEGDTSVTTNVQAPPAGGRTPAPPPPPAGSPKPVPAPVVKPPVKSTPPPVKSTPPPAPKGKYVVVVPYKAGQAAGTKSTLWGIAQHAYGNANGQLWKQVWDAPQNNRLRATRKQPESIQPGDRVWVPFT